jgi:hypothetical protein
MCWAKCIEQELGVNAACQAAGLSTTCRRRWFFTNGTNLVLPIEEPPQVLRHAFPEGALPEKQLLLHLEAAGKSRQILVTKAGQMVRARPAWCARRCRCRTHRERNSLGPRGVSYSEIRNRARMLPLIALGADGRMSARGQGRATKWWTEATRAARNPRISYEGCGTGQQSDCAEI